MPSSCQKQCFNNLPNDFFSQFSGFSLSLDGILKTINSVLYPTNLTHKHTHINLWVDENKNNRNPFIAIHIYDCFFFITEIIHQIIKIMQTEWKIEYINNCIQIQKYMQTVNCLMKPTKKKQRKKWNETILHEPYICKNRKVK